MTKFIGLLFLFIIYPCFKPAAMKQVEIVTVGVVTNATTISLHYLGPSFDLAASFFRKDHGHHFNLTHTYLMDESSAANCVELTSQMSFLMSEWYYKKRTKADAYAFIIPVCTEFTEMNRLLASWNILMMATAVDHASLRNKAITPTAVTTTPTSFASTLGTFFLMLEYFHWSTVAVVHDLSANSGFHTISDQLVPLLREHNMQVSLYEVTSRKSINFSKELQSFRLISRGWVYHLTFTGTFGNPTWSAAGSYGCDNRVVFIGHAQPFRQLVIQASLFGMCNGEYVYILVSVFKAKALGALTWQYGDEYDAIAREAYRSALIVGPDVSVYALSNRTTMKAITTGYVSAFDKTYPVDDASLALVSSTMDAFLIFGQVLEEVLRDNYSKDSFGGRQLVRRMLNRSFDLGFVQFNFDENGQRLIHEELSDMDFITGQFRPVLQLQFNGTKSVLKLADIDWGGPINSSNGTPLNMPVCGYSGDRGPCAGGSMLLTQSELETLVAVLGAAVICLSGAFCYYSKHSHHRFEDHWILLNEFDVRRARRLSIAKSSFIDLDRHHVNLN